LSELLKKYYLPLANFQTGTRAKPPFAEVAEGGFLVFTFFRKKGKGLKGFKVLVGTADSLAEHTFTNVKYSVLYFTWK